MIEEARALLIGAGARAFFSARDLSTSRTLPRDVRDAWRALQSVSRDAHRARFDAVLRAREAGLTAEALTWGDTPLSLAISLLRDVGRVQKGDVVVDPLAGRGNMLLAARALGAEARGVEIDGAHVDAAAPLLARVGASLVQGDARSADVYAGATCVYLAWTSLDAETRATIIERIVGAIGPGARILALTWEPRHPRVSIERGEPRWFPWGRVDVVTATSLTPGTSPGAPSHAR